MVDRQVLPDRDVEFVVHERIGHVPRQGRMAFERRHGARAQAFVRDRILGGDAERESGIVVEEESGRVIIVEKHEHVGLLLREPPLDRLVALEERRPVGVALLLAVVSRADGGHVRRAYSADDSRHALYAVATGILNSLIRFSQSRGPVWCTESPFESTATVTGMSFTSNS